MRLVRVGLIGYGYSGRTFHAPLILATPGLVLSAVASSDPAKVHSDLPSVEVIRDPLALSASSDIDLVVIATPNSSHAALARAALMAGKHVVVDKPFTLDLAEARDLVALAERQRRILAVFQNRRWDSDFLSIRQAMDSGLLGDVLHFESHFDRFRPVVRRRWRESSSPGGGIWFDLGPHLVDQALQLFGLPDRICANLALQREGAQADDWAHALLDYGRRRVILHAGMVAAGGFHRFLVHGTKGTLVKHKPDPQEGQLLVGMRPHAAGWGVDDDDLVFHDAAGGERRMACVRGDQSRFYVGIEGALRGNPNPVPPIQAVAVMAVIDAGVRSSQSGQALPLDLTRAERAAWT